MSMPDPNASLLVVINPDHGARLREIPPGRPLWIAMSPTNAPVVRSLWETRADRGSVLGVTGFEFDDGLSIENNFLNNIDTIDIHHGPHSFPDSPYTELEVLGLSLSQSIRAILMKIGFERFTEGEHHFFAYRTIEAAKRLRT